VSEMTGHEAHEEEAHLIVDKGLNDLGNAVDRGKAGAGLAEIDVNRDGATRRDQHFGKAIAEHADARRSTRRAATVALVERSVKQSRCRLFGIPARVHHRPPPSLSS